MVPVGTIDATWDVKKLLFGAIPAPIALAVGALTSGTGAAAASIAPAFDERRTVMWHLAVAGCLAAA
jgi:hypothetical protein